MVMWNGGAVPSSPDYLGALKDANKSVAALKRERDELATQRDELHERASEAERDAAIARMTINDARKHFLRSTVAAEKRGEALKRERDAMRAVVEAARRLWAEVLKEELPPEHDALWANLHEALATLDKGPAHD